MAKFSEETRQELIDGLAAIMNERLDREGLLERQAAIESLDELLAIVEAAPDATAAAEAMTDHLTARIQTAPPQPGSRKSLSSKRLGGTN